MDFKGGEFYESVEVLVSLRYENFLGFVRVVVAFATKTRSVLYVRRARRGREIIEMEREEDTMGRSMKTESVAIREWLSMAMGFHSLKGERIVIYMAREKVRCTMIMRHNGLR